MKICHKKWIKIYDQSEGNSNVNKNRIKTPMLRADICDFSAYIVVKADIVVTAPDNAKSS